MLSFCLLVEFFKNFIVRTLSYIRLDLIFFAKYVLLVDAILTVEFLGIVIKRVNHLFVACSISSNFHDFSNCFGVKILFDTQFCSFHNLINLLKIIIYNF